MEKLRVRTEIEGLELVLTSVVDSGCLEVVEGGKPVIGVYLRSGQVKMFQSLFQKKEDARWNWFDHILEIVDQNLQQQKEKQTTI